MNKVAETILKQMGGQKFIVMTNAKNFTYGPNNITFSIGSGANNGINKVRITLNPQDLYDIEFYRQRGVDLKVVAERRNIMAENLARTFETITGFRVSLSAMMEEAQRQPKIANTTSTLVFKALVVVNANDYDYAREINAIGFSKFDGPIARDLIQTAEKWGWTPKQYDFAKKLANKYRRQVAANGIDVQEMLNEKPKLPEVTVEEKEKPANVKLYLDKKPEKHGNAYYILNQHLGQSIVKLVGEDENQEYVVEVPGWIISRYNWQKYTTPQKRTRRRATDIEDTLDEGSRLEESQEQSPPKQKSSPQKQLPQQKSPPKQLEKQQKSPPKQLEKQQKSPPKQLEKQPQQKPPAEKSQQPEKQQPQQKPPASNKPNDVKYFFDRAIGYSDPQQIKQLHWFIEDNIIFFYDPNVDVEQEEDPKNPNTVHTLRTWQRLDNDTIQQAKWQINVNDIGKYLKQLGSQPLQGKKAEYLKYDPITNQGDIINKLQIDAYRQPKPPRHHHKMQKSMQKATDISATKYILWR